MRTVTVTAVPEAATSTQLSRLGLGVALGVVFAVVLVIAALVWRHRANNRRTIKQFHVFISYRVRYKRNRKKREKGGGVLPFTVRAHLFFSLVGCDLFSLGQVSKQMKLASSVCVKMQTLFLESGHQVRAFWDRQDLKEGEDWEHGFKRGLERSCLFVPLISGPAIESMKALIPNSEKVRARTARLKINKREEKGQTKTATKITLNADLFAWLSIFLLLSPSSKRTIF